MKTKIKDIATIQSWFFLRTQPKGNTVYLQAKHFDDNGDPKEGALIPDLKDDVKERHLLKPNDILFVAKGTRSFATVYTEEFWPCVASSTFFIIRPNSNRAISEYIALILNQSQNRAYFKNHFSGSTVPSIPKSVLEEFDIPIPPIERQRKLTELYQLHKQAVKIRSWLEEKRQTFISQLILSASNS